MIDSQDVAAVPFNTTDVLGRRLVAWLIDAVLVLMLVVVLDAVLAVLGLITFGLGWTLFALTPLVPFCYAWVFLASRRAATPGQQFLGLMVVEHLSGRRPTALEAFVSTAVYVLSITFLAPVLLLALVTPRNRAPQDVLSGLVMVRRQPLTARHGAWNMSGSSPA